MREVTPGVTRVLGVDACKAGWVAIAVGAGPPVAYVAGTIDALVSKVEEDGPVGLVAIDIPIGLPDAGRRAADGLARRLIGPRASSVFTTPVRAAIGAPDHETAVEVNRRLAGEGVSRQAFGLKEKLLQVERFALTGQFRVIEVHPEVCFAYMNEGPLTSGKATWAGAEHRRRLLARNGIELVGDLGLAGLNAGVDDVLDAGAAAWTAARALAGHATSLPDPPEHFSDGWPAAIWF